MLDRVLWRFQSPLKNPESPGLAGASDGFEVFDFAGMIGADSAERRRDRMPDCTLTQKTYRDMQTIGDHVSAIALRLFSCGNLKIVLPWVRRHAAPCADRIPCQPQRFGGSVSDMGHIPRGRAPLRLFRRPRPLPVQAQIVSLRVV